MGNKVKVYINSREYIIESDESVEYTREVFEKYDIAVDCLLGTGFKGEVNEKISKVIDYINDNPDLYDSKIWEGQGVTYQNLYNTTIGEWEIYKIYNKEVFFKMVKILSYLLMKKMVQLTFIA